MDKKHLPMPKNFTFFDEIDFYFNINKCGEDECWEWVGKTFGARTPEQRKPCFCLNRITYVATRLMYWLVSKIDPGENLVLHNCDNPLCMNPKHLWLGNKKDNAIDAQNKVRLSPLDPYNRKQFTDNQIAEMRQEHQNGESLSSLANRFDTNKSTICNIVNGKTYK